MNSDIMRKGSSFENKQAICIDLFRLGNELRIAVDLAEMLNSFCISSV